MKDFGTSYFIFGIMGFAGLFNFYLGSVTENYLQQGVAILLIIGGFCILGVVARDHYNSLNP